MKRNYSYPLPALVLIFLFTWISCTPPRTGPTTFYLVRHAEKAVDGTDDPDLTEAGKTRAMKIATMLKDERVERLYATSYKRTQQTLQPLADQFGLDIRIYNHRDTASINSMVADCTGRVAVIAGHSNSTPRLANRLIGKEEYGDMDEGDYTKMFKIRLNAGKPVSHEIVIY